MTRGGMLASVRQETFHVLAASAALTALMSCGGSRDAGPAAPQEPAQVLSRLVVSLPSDTMQVGQSYSASAAGFDQTGKPMGISTPAWSTESPAIATVSPGGVVVGVTPGLTTLKVLVGAKQGYTALTVIAVPVAKLSVTPAATTVNIGLTAQLSATVLDASGNALTGRLIAWTSSDATKATVSSSGLVTAFATGVVTITATCEGVSARTVISVQDLVVRVASVAVNPPQGSLLVGQSAQLAATLKDAAGNSLPGRIATWTSSATDVARVSATGLVVGVAAGTAIITATADGVSAAATFTVDGDLAISIARPDSLAPVADTLKVQATVKTVHGLASVLASVEPVGAYFNSPLTKVNVGRFTPVYAWICRIDIRDLGTGDYLLVVAVIDSLGTKQTGSVKFHHDYAHEGGSGSAPGKKSLSPAPVPSVP